MEEKTTLRSRAGKYFVPAVLIVMIASFVYLVFVDPFVNPTKKDDLQLSAEEQYEQFNQVLDTFTSAIGNPFDQLTEVFYGESAFQSAQHQILGADGELVQLYSSKPEGSGPFPLVILMHGNTASDRESTRLSLVFGERLAEELEAIVVTVNWRESELAQLDLIDVVSTIEWGAEVQEVIDQPVYLVGVERGAYLSLLASTKNDVDGVVNIFGYIDPNAHYQYLLDNDPDAADDFLDITECSEAQIITRCLQSYEVASLLEDDMSILSLYSEAEQRVTVDQLALLESATNPAREAIVYDEETINADTFLLGTGDDFDLMYDDVFSWLSNQLAEDTDQEQADDTATNPQEEEENTDSGSNTTEQ